MFWGEINRGTLLQNFPYQSQVNAQFSSQFRSNLCISAMLLSRLRRFFSLKSSSSTAYLRLHTPPPRPIQTADGDSDWKEVKPPRPIQTAGGDSDWEEVKLPRTIQTADGDSDGEEAKPPRHVLISDGDCGNDEKSSAMFRIENELREMEEEAATHCSFGPVGDDIFRWGGIVIGPAYSCYEGGIFHISIQFPSDYPLSPPFIKFLTKIFHPNVEEDGTICIDILKENWSSALTIEKLMLSICSILSNPDPQHYINEASRMYLNNWLKYNEIAREWTKQYAMGD